MPDQVAASAKTLVASQYTVRPGTLDTVFHTNYIINNPQLLGSTPMWCKSTPDGTNNQIYYDARNNNQALYFPSYEIAKDNASRPLVKFTQPNKPSVDTQLEITLKPVGPTPTQQANAAGASLSACPAAYYTNSAGTDTTTVHLSYNSGTMNLAFDEIAIDPSTGNLKCVAKMTDDGVIGEVMGTLVNDDNDPSKRASLLITRLITSVGVAAGAVNTPIPPTQPQPPVQPPTGVRPPWWRVIDHRALRMPLMAPAAAITQPTAAITAQPAAAAAAAGASILIGHLPVNWVGNLDHMHPITQGDGQTTIGQPPGTPLYFLLSSQAVTATVANVWFNETLNPDIISDIKGVKPTQAGYKPYPVPGLDNPLLQDVNDESSLFYLPDSFKVVRSDTAPYLPLLTVTISGTTLEDGHATVFFTALPVVDAQKLADAKALIQKGDTGHTIKVQPMPTPKGTQFGLFLPGSTPFTPRDVPVALDDALNDSPQLTLDDFQTAFASLTAQKSQYLQGKVTVPIGDTVVTVPLVMRADDFPGQYFQQTRSIDGWGRSVKLVLTNAIETAIQVDGLPIGASRSGAPVECTVTYDPPLPASIAAADDDHPSGGTLTVTVTPGSGAADASLDLTIDQGQCHVVPDAGALLRAVLNPNVPVKASRAVDAVVPAVLFDGDSPDKKILTITMSFLNGNTIRFVRAPDSPALVPSDKPGQVNLTVFDYVLRRTGDSDAIKYKLAITYANGHTVTDADWRTAPNDNFVVDLP
jgi:hypothetical protein